MPKRTVLKTVEIDEKFVKRFRVLYAYHNAFKPGEYERDCALTLTLTKLAKEFPERLDPSFWFYNIREALEWKEESFMRSGSLIILYLYKEGFSGMVTEGYDVIKHLLDYCNKIAQGFYPDEIEA